MKLKCLGAAGVVTGSSYWLENDAGDGLIVDMGLFQGLAQVERLNREPLNISVGRLKGVIITHAHLDHCGRLPMLVDMGYKGPVYMTAATREIVEIGLMDSAKLAHEDKGEEALYGEEEVNEVLTQTSIVEYHQKVDVGDFRFWLLDAGHILGSASVVVEEKPTGKRLFLSGDLGNSPDELVQPTEVVDRADWVVMESTYGDRTHGQENAKEVIARIIKDEESSDGVVLIPSFSIQRSQELLYMFDQLKKEGKMKNETRVFFDSPMAIKVTDVFRRYPELYSDRLQMQVKLDDPFDFPGLVLVERSEMSKQIKSEVGPRVILAGSGMMNGGRILHHALEYLPNKNTSIVFVGYQAIGTLGRRILDGNTEVSIYGQRIGVNAKIFEVTSLSAHADQQQLIDWLDKVRGVKQVLLTHGDEEPRLTMEKLIKEKWGYKVMRPRLEEVIELV